MFRDISISGYVLAIFVVGVALKMYLESDAFNLKCIVSNVDGNKYCVRERAKLQLAADLLAKITQKLKKLTASLGEKYPNRENVKRLVENFNPRKVKEILPTSEYTAYSENKGEKLAFCTTTTKTGDKLIDENTLMFVGIHEIAHVMTKSIGHNKEFWDNFKFMLEHAVEIKLYNPIDYKEKPKKYCGMQITDNPFYDM
jgi:predicted metal-dependent hydrolase|tara:strand:+ start:300 stop:896 length:597 start_codon:yes stop_codon:yes gene_type:complete